MKEMTLQDIKDISIEILLDVDTFCRKNNIKYSLAFGTQIGAIRHKGFIPWDDDIDIVMTRPEYDKFCSLYNPKSKYAIFNRENSNCDIAFTRICEMNKTYVDSLVLPWIKQRTGVWIDVFPIDAIECSEAVISKKSKVIKEYYESGLRYRRSKATMPIHNNVIGWVKLCLLHIFSFLWSRSIDRHIDLLNEVQYEDSTLVASLSCPNTKVFKDIYKKDLFNDYIDVEFEGCRFMSVRDYDTMLRTSFGDYMQLPPEEDRTPAHQFNRYYWK